MKVITCAELQDNLADILGYVIDDHAPVLINREDKQAVVIISLDDCSAFKETAYLLKIPADGRNSALLYPENFKR
ncbi:type II toxin-antitoxin system Phd/YefM family antitoxin [Acinetobacter johnsonii]|uniref:type II toxin-antitoxin system Phd/YefM family antitoxin n=1 Tax=Acinetobacter TaxID=469 RepID=UPI0013734AB1|nr:type II toxin-antitoxin system prevent-host-death family antitoxin [Acinetobacter haemolyticus]NAR47104.1 type II toxin-antitoxin system prevent-host-death family antitoxin [Acinetobacter haemolyticus]